MHPSAQAWMCHLIGLFVASEESVPQRGTRMRSPVQARNERSAGIEKSPLLPNDVTRGATRAFDAQQDIPAQWPMSVFEPIVIHAHIVLV